MALKRSLLDGMGLSKEQADAIIEAHTETIDGLKGQIADLKEKAGDYDALKQERDDLKQAAEAAKGGTDWKAEYDKLKAATEAKETAAKVESAYKKLLKDAHIDDDMISDILSVTKLDGMKLDKDGALKDAEALTEAIKTKYARFIVTEQTKGVPAKTPPVDNNTPAFESMNLTQKMQYANQHPNDAAVREWLSKPAQPSKPADGGNSDGAQK